MALREFTPAYLEVFRTQRPREFNRLVRSGQIEGHLKAKAQEARDLFQALTANTPRDQDGEVPMNIARQVEEVVFSQMLEIPAEKQPTPDDPLATTPPR